MKNIVILMAFAFCTTFIYGQVYVQPENTAKETIYRPTSKFDSIEAKNALAKGTSTIVGNTVIKQVLENGKRDYWNEKAGRMVVILVPLTPYFKEYYNLMHDKRKNNPKKNRMVGMSEEAGKYNLQAVTNSDGQFTFPDMKPGKYYLFGYYHFSKNFQKSQYSGSGYNQYGGRTDYYTPTTTTYNYSDLLQATVEIKKDGQVVKTTLKK